MSYTHLAREERFLIHNYLQSRVFVATGFLRALRECRLPLAAEGPSDNNTRYHILRRLASNVLATPPGGFVPCGS